MGPVFGRGEAAFTGQQVSLIGAIGRNRGMIQMARRKTWLQGSSSCGRAAHMVCTLAVPGVAAAEAGGLQGPRRSHGMKGRTMIAGKSQEAVMLVGTKNERARRE